MAYVLINVVRIHPEYAAFLPQQKNLLLMDDIKLFAKSHLAVFPCVLTLMMVLGSNILYWRGVCSRKPTLVFVGASIIQVRAIRGRNWTLPLLKRQRHRPTMSNLRHGLSGSALVQPRLFGVYNLMGGSVFFGRKKAKFISCLKCAAAWLGHPSMIHDVVIIAWFLGMFLRLGRFALC